METRLAGTGASGTNPRPQLDATSPENERTRYARTATQQAVHERYQISTHIKIAASSAYQSNSCTGVFACSLTHTAAAIRVVLVRFFLRESKRWSGFHRWA